MAARDTRTTRRGFTLIELAMSVCFLVILTAGGAMLAQRSRGAYRATTDESGLETATRRAIDRVARELVSTGDAVLPPMLADDFGSSDFVYQQAIGLTGVDIDWGVPRRLAFEYAAGELDDGVDNDGNGLVDDGMLVLTRDDGGAAEQRIVLCHDVREYQPGEEPNGVDDNGNGVVDELGFNVQRVDDVLVIRLTLEQRDAADGLLTRTLTTSVRIRN